MKVFVLPATFVQTVVNYLARRPYAEVAEMLQQIISTPMQEMAEAAPPGDAPAAILPSVPPQAPRKLNRAERRALQTAKLNGAMPPAAEPPSEGASA